MVQGSGGSGFRLVPGTKTAVQERIAFEANRIFKPLEAEIEKGWDSGRKPERLAQARADSLSKAENAVRDSLQQTVRSRYGSRQHDWAKIVGANTFEPVYPSGGSSLMVSFSAGNVINGEPPVTLGLSKHETGFVLRALEQVAMKVELHKVETTGPFSNKDLRISEAYLSRLILFEDPSGAKIGVFDFKFTATRDSGVNPYVRNEREAGLVGTLIVSLHPGADRAALAIGSLLSRIGETVTVTEAGVPSHREASGEAKARRIGSERELAAGNLEAAQAQIAELTAKVGGLEGDLANLKTEASTVAAKYERDLSVIEARLNAALKARQEISGSGVRLEEDITQIQGMGFRFPIFQTSRGKLIERAIARHEERREGVLEELKRALKAAGEKA